MNRPWPTGRADVLLSLAAFVLLSCHSSSVKPAAQAESFVAALNARDIESLLSLSADTLLFREQRWETASDGSGFTLGRARDTVVAGAAAKHAFFTQLVARVHVRGPRVVERPPARESLLTRELANADTRWSRLDLLVFLRGEGDVEHTVLTGIDPTTHKVAAFYVN